MDTKSILSKGIKIETIKPSRLTPEEEIMRFLILHKEGKFQIQDIFEDTGIPKHIIIGVIDTAVEKDYLQKELFSYNKKGYVIFSVTKHGKRDWLPLYEYVLYY